MARLWPFIPEDITAKLIFQTNVLPAISTEQRVKRRVEYPRLELTYRGRLFNDEIFLAKAITEAADSELLVPDFRYAQHSAGPYVTGSLDIVLDTDYWYPVATESIIAWVSNESYYQSTISSVGSGQITADDGPASAINNFLIAPLNTMKIPDGINISLQGPIHGSFSFTAVLDVYKDLSGSVASFPTFQTYTVMTDRDILVGSSSQSIVKMVSKIDTISGILALEEKFNHVDKFGTMSFKDGYLQGTFQREAFFHSVSGRLTPFWKPTWNRDMVLLSNAGAAATTIIVAAGAASVNADYIDKRINISKVDGTHEQYEITGCVIAAGQATLTITPGLATALNIVDVITISELNLMRLRTDTVPIEYGTALKSEISVGTEALDNDL